MADELKIAEFIGNNPTFITELKIINSDRAFNLIKDFGFGN
jgi:hypothetical protein